MKEHTINEDGARGLLRSLTLCSLRSNQQLEDGCGRGARGDFRDRNFEKLHWFHVTITNINESSERVFLFVGILLTIEAKSNSLWPPARYPVFTLHSGTLPIIGA